MTLTEFMNYLSTPRPAVHLRMRMCSCGLCVCDRSVGGYVVRTCTQRRSRATTVAASRTAAARQPTEIMIMKDLERTGARRAANGH